MYFVCPTIETQANNIIKNKYNLFIFYDLYKKVAPSKQNSATFNFRFSLANSRFHESKVQVKNQR